MLQKFSPSETGIKNTVFQYKEISSSQYIYIAVLIIKQWLIIPFSPNVPFLYPLKTSENP